jgi:hypothetical protein
LRRRPEGDVRSWLVEGITTSRKPVLVVQYELKRDDEVFFPALARWSAILGKFHDLGRRMATRHLAIARRKYVQTTRFPRSYPWEKSSFPIRSTAP